MNESHPLSPFRAPLPCSEKDRELFTEEVTTRAKCGICEQDSHEKFKRWPSGFSNWAHLDCYEHMKDAEKDMNRVIQRLFQKKIWRELAHAHAVHSLTLLLKNAHRLSFSYPPALNASNLLTYFDAYCPVILLKYDREKKRWKEQRDSHNLAALFNAFGISAVYEFYSNNPQAE